MKGKTIGKLAKEAGIGVETIRFYEQRGILKQPPAPASGWRQYSEEALSTIRYIKVGQQLGFTLSEMERLQGIAAPNTIAISDATYRLVQGYFACQDLGVQTLRGVTEAMRVYHVLRESGATSRLEVAQPRGLTPLVGRESEVTLLQERWEQVKAGHGQMVLLTGDAGIGKSRLVQMLKEHVANEPHTRWECRSAEYAQNTALFPLVDLFQRILRLETYETPDAKLAKLEHALNQYAQFIAVCRRSK